MLLINSLRRDRVALVYWMGCRVVCWCGVFMCLRVLVRLCCGCVFAHFCRWCAAHVGLRSCVVLHYGCQCSYVVAVVLLVSVSFFVIAFGVFFATVFLVVLCLLQCLALWSFALVAWFRRCELCCCVCLCGAFVRCAVYALIPNPH